ncbi:MAG: hypothetical protein M0015_18925 [Betaproteobacteria bacterium]|nr:hypothetical protein [Betaproteobacteria bacterium]
MKTLFVLKGTAGRREILAPFGVPDALRSGETEAGGTLRHQVVRLAMQSERHRALVLSQQSRGELSDDHPVVPGRLGRIREEQALEQRDNHERDRRLAESR